MKALKYLLLCTLGCFVAVLSYANHITGGQMYYTLLSESGGNYTYKVTMMLYRDCYSQGAPLDETAPIAVFNNETRAMTRIFQVAMTRQAKLEITSPDPCILNPPTVCYDVGFYEFTVTLPAAKNGYTVAYQRCCRIAGINNLVGSSNVGATYTAEIPGTALNPNDPSNNSAQFVGEDRVVICANSPMSYSFAAKDPDGDELRYYFGEAYVGGGQGQGPQGGVNTPSPNPPAEPPYQSVPYSAPYSASSPLGAGVTINSTTGEITGIAPNAGIYVVTVYVDEYRNGKRIATQRKDLQVKIASCQRAAAALNPEYVTCDGLTRTFKNEVPANSLIKTYYWDFGVAGTDADVSTDANPTFTYPAPGTYTLTLITNKGLECSDEAKAIVKVYPGFFPDFTFAGICVNKPTQFTDKTTTNFGVVDSWKWDFGDPASTSDVSTAQNPTWTYPQMGKKNVRFIVTNSMGCVDTIFKEVEIIDKPPIKVLTKDTLMCVGDSVTLAAEGNGVFTWTPADRIIGGNSATPTVFPTATTTYTVELNDNGCINRDVARVRVVSEVTLKARTDTTICLTDSVQLSAATDGLRYSWTPGQTINNPSILNPKAKPGGTTTYQITARIGRCSATDDVVVTTAPYPKAKAGPDTTICHEASAQLAGSVDGTTFSWTPAETLTGATTLNPVATPLTTTAYVLTTRNEQSGCPKPVSDTVVVQVLPDIKAFAGRDTAIVVDQPLLFNASGGVRYEWSPATNLNATDIPDPIGRYSAEVESIRYTVLVYNEQNCVDSASITVRVFKTEPQVFVPTGFTPNGDGQNDVIRPIAVGMTRIEYFRVYNRWGQLVFSTTVNGKGWDGRINGKEQGTGVYVWVVKGTDFTGKVVSAKGTVTLIR
jgi:gliding motility-associated-like protein